MRLSHVSFLTALGFALACGGSGDATTASPAAAPVATPAAPVPEAPKPLFVNTKWDLIWPNRSGVLNYIGFNADGTLADLADNNKNTGKWTADGRKLHFDWRGDWIHYDGELSEDGASMSGTWNRDDGKNGEWKAVPTTYVPKAPSTRSASTSSGSGLPTCYDVTTKCKAKSDDRSRTCWSSCSGNYPCQDACNETNRVERLECERPQNCK